MRLGDVLGIRTGNKTSKSTGQCTQDVVSHPEVVAGHDCAVGVFIKTAGSIVKDVIILDHNLAGAVCDIQAAGVGVNIVTQYIDFIAADIDGVVVAGGKFVVLDIDPPGVIIDGNVEGVAADLIIVDLVVIGIEINSTAVVLS